MKKQPRLEPLPALSAYQEQLHHDIHGPAEPLPPNLTRKTKTGSVQPLKDKVSPLPPLPMDLEYQQRTMEGEMSVYTMHDSVHKATTQSCVCICIQLCVKPCHAPLPPATLLPLPLARYPLVRSQQYAAPDLPSWYQTPPLYPPSERIMCVIL